MKRLVADGATVEMDGFDISLVEPWDEHMWFHDGDWEGPLSIHRREIVEVAITETLRGRVTRVSPYRGGEIVLGVGTGEGGDDVGVLAWRGPYHCVTTHVSPGSADLVSAVKLFSRFHLSDHPEGLLLARPRGQRNRGALTRHSLVTTFKDRPILIEIRPARSNLDLLPEGRGMSVQGGELWRQSYGDMTDQVDLVLLSESALTVISGYESASETGVRTAVPLGTTMRVSWVAA